MVISQIVASIKELLEKNENVDVNFEINVIIKHVFNENRVDIARDISLDENNCKKAIIIAEKRSEGYPLQYILGYWQFFDLDILVGEGVLIPRADTEIVVQEAIDILKNIAMPTVLDLCAGSGAIGLAIKKYCSHSFVVSIEMYDKAFEYLELNIEKNNLQLLPIKADALKFYDNIEDESFDVIISNPPYIKQELRGSLQREVSFEPEEALFAPNQGLRFYISIAEDYKDKLKPKGYLIFEYGYDQQVEVRDIVLKYGYKIIKEIYDLSNNPRGIIAQKL